MNGLALIGLVVIIVPGLGDNRGLDLLTKVWRWPGVRTVVFKSEWKSSENYQSKLERLLDLIDKELAKGKVSLVGTSAGGSLVLNAFSERKDKINRVITICARLRKGQIHGFRGFEERTKEYPAFAESITRAEESEKMVDKSKIMTVRALLGDELVPNNTAMIDGAKNIAVPLGEHMLSIAGSLTVFSRPIVEFLGSN